MLIHKFVLKKNENVALPVAVAFNLVGGNSLAYILAAGPFLQGSLHLLDTRRRVFCRRLDIKI